VPSWCGLTLAGTWVCILLEADILDVPLKMHEDAKKKFFSSFNAVYSKIGRFASEEVVVNLLDTKCIAPMLYGIEACPVTSRHKHSLDFTVTRVFMKILCTKSNDIVLECQNFFGFLPVSQRIAIRTSRFLERLFVLKIYCAMFSSDEHFVTKVKSISGSRK